MLNSYLPFLDVATIRSDLAMMASPPAPPAELRCPACGQRLRAPAQAAGRPGRCRACQVVFPIPPWRGV